MPSEEYTSIRYHRTLKFHLELAVNKKYCWSL